MRNQIFIISIVSIISYTLQAQAPMSMFLGSGVDQSYRIIKLPFITQYQESESYIEQRNNIESPIKSWRSDVGLDWLIHGKWYLQSGLSFGSYGWKTNTESENSSIHHYFLEAPFVGRIQFLNGDLKPYVLIGVAASIYLTSHKTLYLNNTSQNDWMTNSFYTMHYAGMFGGGLSYRIKDNFHIYTQVLSRRNFRPIFSDVSHDYLYSYGVSMGVRKALSNKKFQTDNANNRIQ